MLTAIERKWLTMQRELMVAAAQRADIYTQAIAGYNRLPPRWRPIKAWKVKRAILRLTFEQQVCNDEVARRSRLINSWVGAYNVINGKDRGPIQP